MRVFIYLCLSSIVFAAQCLALQPRSHSLFHRGLGLSMPRLENVLRPLTSPLYSNQNTFQQHVDGARFYSTKRDDSSDSKGSTLADDPKKSRIMTVKELQAAIDHIKVNDLPVLLELDAKLDANKLQLTGSADSSDSVRSKLDNPQKQFKIMTAEERGRAIEEAERLWIPTLCALDDQLDQLAALPVPDAAKQMPGYAPPPQSQDG